MEEGKKKMIMIGVIVVCIAAAIVITIATQGGGGGGLDTIEPGKAMVWIQCKNPDCGHVWQMDKRDYYEYIEKYRAGFVVPGIPCPKCGEKEGYKVEKCPKCGTVFESQTTGYSDKCPNCGYSAMEELRKKARSEK